MKNNINQEDVNQVWSAVWQKQAKSDFASLFTQRLFLEGYPVFKKYIPKEDNFKILDVGSGSGRYGLQIARDFPQAQVVLSDIVQSSVDFMKDLTQWSNLNNVQVKQEDIFNFSFPDNHFDLIFCDVVIQHLSRDLDAIREMKRILKPGGLMMVSGVNKYNFHSIYKALIKLIRKPYLYNFERSYTHSDLKDLVIKNDLLVLAQDGFYPAYGIFRLKYISKVFKFLGKAINRTTKFLDKFTYRFFSKTFGFEIFVVARKKENIADSQNDNIKVKHSGVVRLKYFDDHADGNLVIAESQRSVPFDIKRVYYITNLGNKNAIRGKHAHKQLEQYIFCVNGSFQLSLDDGANKQDLILDSPYYGIRLGAKLWHEMSSFSNDCVILVFCSDYFKEDDYIRDYNEFLNYIKI